MENYTGYENQPQAPAAAPAARACVSCGNPLNPTQKFCPVCGTPNDPMAAPVAAPVAAPEPVAITCSRCGAQLNLTQKFCPTCGESSATGIPVYGEATTATPEQPKKSHLGLILGLVGGGVGLLVTILVLVLVLSPNKFQQAFENAGCSYIWADYGDDYLKIDTNPFDYDDDGLAYIAAYYAIEDVNRELGLPSSLFDEMGETRGIDGTQSYSYNGIYVTWSYHPDEGLEVTYWAN